MMGYYGDWAWGQWLAMSVTMLATWGLVAWLVVIAIRGWRPENRRDTADPQTILERRYAHGELTEAEYLHARAVLNHGSSQDVPS